MKTEFIVFPAIDLRRGEVVRLQEGDPLRQTMYSHDPAETALLWLQQGAKWLHVVNLDGAFGEADDANRAALSLIIEKAKNASAAVQFGGGVRSLQALEDVFALGVARVVLGTAALEDPSLAETARRRWGSERIALGLDAQQGIVRTRGWKEATGRNALDVALQYARLGLRWIVFTDIARDGMGKGLNLEFTRRLAEVSGLKVVASGGVNGLEDVRCALQTGLSGVIIGRALYEGLVKLEDCLSIVENENLGG